MANQYDVRKSILDAGLNYPINTNQMNNALLQSNIINTAKKDLNNVKKNLNYSAINTPSGYSSLGSQMAATNQFQNIQPKGYSSLGSQMNAMNLPMPSGSGQKKVADNTPPNFKNNLLNYLVSPKGKGMAQGLLEASGYSDTPVTFGQALSLATKRGNEAQAQADATELARQKQAMDNLLIQSQIYKNYQPSGNPKDQYRPITKEEKLAFGIPENVPARFNITQNKPEIMSTGSGTKVDVDITNEAEGEGSKNFFKTSGGNFAEYVDLTQKNSANADIDNQSLNRFNQYLEIADTGNIAGFKIELLNWAKSLGLDLSDTRIDELGSLEALNSVAGRFVMQQVQKTKGAVSDREMAYFMKISANIGNSVLGNKLIISMARQMNDRAIAENDLLQTFLDEQYLEDSEQSNYSLDRKWQKRLRKFREENQLFTGDIAEEIKSFHKDNEIEYDDSTTKIEKTLSDYPDAEYIGVMEDGTLGFKMMIDGEEKFLYI